MPSILARNSSGLMLFVSVMDPSLARALSFEPTFIPDLRLTLSGRTTLFFESTLTLSMPTFRPTGSIKRPHGRILEIRVNTPSLAVSKVLGQPDEARSTVGHPDV